MSNLIVTCICGKCDLSSQEHKAGEFLINSNLIEGENTIEALEDAHDAWEYAISLKKINLAELLEIHRLLMHRLNPRIAGKIREVDVWVGGRRGANPTQIKRKLEEFFQVFPMEVFGRLDLENRKSDASKFQHIQFEEIHPFEDSNGRTGRILYNWQRLKYGLPIHVIHQGTEQYEYYKWFKKDNS